MAPDVIQPSPLQSSTRYFPPAPPSLACPHIMLLFSIHAHILISNTLSVYTCVAPIMKGASFYGNQVIMRSKHMETKGKRAWIDGDTHLANGTMEEFHMYIAPVSGTPVNVRLQLWESEALSGVNNTFRLVWEKRVELPVNGAQRFVVSITLCGHVTMTASTTLCGSVTYIDNN